MGKNIKSYLFIKRVIDVFISVTGLLLLLPGFILISTLIKVTSRGPVFFRQERVGLNGRTFQIIKFRTMITASPNDQLLTVKGDTRITRIGKYLRKYKLDELPQLYNVLKGEMSLAGPRPEVPKYVKTYSKEQLQVLTVKPGITDYASIKYYYENELLDLIENPEEIYIKKIMPDKLAQNLKYIEECSLATDLKIISLTLQKCFFSKK